MRVVVEWKGPDKNAASTSEMGRFETELHTQKDNLKGLEQLNVEWVKRGVAKTVYRRIILDIDSSETVKALFSDQGTSIAPMGGRNSSSLSWSAT